MESLMMLALLGAQATIMFSLGIGLRVSDFSRVLKRPFSMGIGLIGQVLILPILAFIIIHIFSLSPMFAAGLMLLSFCPGGVTSNIISKLSKADVAMSVSLTASLSVLSFLTVPPLAAWAINYFLGNDAPAFSFFDLAIVTFLVTTTPVMIGVAIRHFKEHIALVIESVIEKVAIVLWVLIVSFAIIRSWDILTNNFAILGGALLLLPSSLIILGLFVTRLLKINIREGKTIAIEISMQNSPLAIALAATIVGSDQFITELALPAAIYSVTMYIVALPVILVFRRWKNEPDLVNSLLQQHGA